MRIRPTPYTLSPCRKHELGTTLKVPLCPGFSSGFALTAPNTPHLSTARNLSNLNVAYWPKAEIRGAFKSQPEPRGVLLIRERNHRSIWESGKKREELAPIIARQTHASYKIDICP